MLRDTWQGLRRYDRTYSQLRDGLRGFEMGSCDAGSLHDVVRHVMKDLRFSSCLRVLLGFGYFGIPIAKGLEEFRSNRFFLDAVSVDLLPSAEEIADAFSGAVSAARSAGIVSSEDEFAERLGSLLGAGTENRELPGFLADFDLPVLGPEHFSALDQDGYLIVENALPLSLCDYLAERLAALAEFEAKSLKGGFFYGSGRMQRVYHLIAKDKIFQELLLHPVSHQVMAHMFYRETHHDKYYLTSFHGNILKPGAEPQVWHIDANVPDPVPTWIIRANSNYVVQDYTSDNGATEIILGSQQFARKPTPEEAQRLRMKSVALTAPKGSLVFWHGHLWHRSGENRSCANRAALLATYASSVFREVCMEENPYLSMNSNAASELSAGVKRILGWDHGSKNYA